MPGKQALLLLVVLFFSFAGMGQQVLPADTTKSFKIDRVWVTPKTSFKFDTLGICTPDTLRLTSCADYLYSPFGNLKDKKDLRHSVLKSFKVTDKKHWTGGQEFNLQILKSDSNKLILFFDKDPEDAKGSYILNGLIYDSTIHFSNGVKVGMSRGDFYKTFFDLFPIELQKKYKVVSISTCDNAVIHYYNFKDDKLVFVLFDADERYWQIKF